eukprot:scaffold3103_cov252-Chaetoceros_neogracile.AAC.1
MGDPATAAAVLTQEREEEKSHGENSEDDEEGDPYIATYYEGPTGDVAKAVSANCHQRYKDPKQEISFVSSTQCKVISGI